jgi:Glycosyltransferase family 87
VADITSNPPTATGGLSSGRSPAIVPLVAAFLLFAFALYQALATNYQRDFFIFRLGSEFVLRGENPYNIEKIREPIAAHFTAEEEKEFVANCGYFMPPMAILEFMPFALLPWVAAKVAWAVVIGIAAYFIARLPGVYLPAGSPPPGIVLGVCVPLLLVLNPVTPSVVLIGQYTVLFVGCAAAGLLAFERGRPYLAAVLWALSFAKPHLAMPLIPLAWYLGGWRPALLLVFLLVALNAIGATIIGGTPMFMRDYLNFLPQAREAVLYNRVQSNPTILSWNRLLYALGGPLVELSVVTIFAGYLVGFGLIALRCALANAKPSATWAIAMTAVGGVFCAQVIVYESLFLLLAVPWIRDLFASGYGVRGLLAVGLLAMQTIPQKVMAGFGIPMHHPLAVGLLVVLVFTGPLTFSRSPSGVPKRLSSYSPR